MIMGQPLFIVLRLLGGWGLAVGGGRGQGCLFSVAILSTIMVCSRMTLPLLKISSLRPGVGCLREFLAELLEVPGDGPSP